MTKKKRLFRILLLAALASTPAFAAITQVGVGIKLHVSSATSTSTSLAYTPTTGNTVIIFGDLPTGSTSPSCTDGTTTLTEGATTPTANSKYLAVFTLLSANSAHTAFACSWTTSAANASFFLFEYSGNTGGLSTTVTAASTSTSPTCAGNGCISTSSGTVDISITLDDANDWLVCQLDSLNSLTMTVGNQRLNENTSPIGILGDNTAASGTVHCTATQTAGSMRVLAVELRLSAAAVTNKPYGTIF